MSSDADADAIDRIVREGLGPAYESWVEFREAESGRGLWGPEQYWSLIIGLTSCRPLCYWW